MKLTISKFKNSLFSTAAVALFALTSNGQTTINFGYTGGSQSWTVPQCVTSMTVTVAGASGAGNAYGQTGGNGAVVTGTFTVSPGDVYQINVGGAGQNPNPGWNGGGSGQLSNIGGYNSGGGGGASSISIAPFGLNNRIIVAGGGGGAGG